MNWLDNIYSKHMELLTKAHLEYLAVHYPAFHELNLIASCPSQIFSLPIRVLRCFNSAYGWVLLVSPEKRATLKRLNNQYQHVFRVPWSEGQVLFCQFLFHVNEMENFPIYMRFFMELSVFSSGTTLFLEDILDCLEKMQQWFEFRITDIIQRLHKISYQTIIRLYDCCSSLKLQKINSIFINQHKCFYWMEYEDFNFQITFPENSNSFIDEAIDQQNCLLELIPKIINGTILILFMRKKKSPNSSFITLGIEEKKGKYYLTQAYACRNSKIPSVCSQWLKHYAVKIGVIISQQF